MPYLSAVATIDLPHKVAQQSVKECAQQLFEPSFPQVKRMLSACDNTEIVTRNFCKPLDYYKVEHCFQEQNDDYIRITLQYAVEAVSYTHLDVYKRQDWRLRHHALSRKYDHRLLKQPFLLSLIHI